MSTRARAGRLDLGLLEQRVELGDAGGGAGGERPGRDGVDADALGPELGGDVADGDSSAALATPMML